MTPFDKQTSTFKKENFMCPCNGTHSKSARNVPSNKAEEARWDLWTYITMSLYTVMLISFCLYSYRMHHTEKDSLQILLIMIMILSTIAAEVTLVTLVPRFEVKLIASMLYLSVFMTLIRVVAA